MPSTLNSCYAGDNAQNTVSPGNSTQPGTPVTVQSPSPAPTGFFGKIKQTFQNVVSGIFQQCTLLLQVESVKNCAVGQQHSLLSSRIARACILDSVHIRCGSLFA